MVMISSNGGMIIVEEIYGVLKRYETGEFCFEPMEKKSKIFKGVSKKTRQRILVIGKMKYNNLSYKKAVKEVAKELGISTSTVYDKMQRGLDKTSDEIQTLIELYLDEEGKDEDFIELEELLLDNLGDKKREEDEAVIKKFFNDKLFVF